MTPLYPRFLLGRVVATPGALAALERSGESGGTYVARHHLGDWGELCDEDKATNDHALVRGDRLMSAYHLHNGEKIWIITEADRSVTTLLLPEEY